MNLERLYMIQCLSESASKTRLDSVGLELVLLLKKTIQDARDMDILITKLKKNAFLYRIASRLEEIYGYISRGRVDFLRLSEKFQEHSSSLAGDLSALLDEKAPHVLKEILRELKEDPIVKPAYLSKDFAAKPGNQEKKNENRIQKSKTDQIKEQYLFDDINGHERLELAGFEYMVLRPIRGLDEFLKLLVSGSYSREDLRSYSEILSRNLALSKKFGFGMITNMLKIFSGSLDLIDEGRLRPSAAVVENMRACLIVIVAIVRQKEVDITSYLNRAEVFGEKILNNYQG